MTAEDRILVVKLADIGDAVLSLPAIQSLHEAYPKSRIDVLSTDAGANVFRMSPAVDEVLTLAKQRFDHIRGLISPGGMLELASLSLKLRLRRYRAVVVLHHLTTNFGARKFRALAQTTGAPVVAGLDNGRGGFLTHRANDFGFGERTEWEYALAVVEALGADPRPVRPILAIPPVAQRSAKRILMENNVENRYAVIHTEVGDFSPARGWALDRFAEVARGLVDHDGLGVVLVGTNPDGLTYDEFSGIEGVRNIVSGTSFAELCAIVKGASVVVGCDSSVSHLAGAFDRPLVTLFGPTNLAAWKPYGAIEHILDDSPFPEERALALSLGLPCSPCIYSGFRLGRLHGCRTRTCMMAVPPDAVSEAARHVLARPGRDDARPDG